MEPDCCVASASPGQTREIGARVGAALEGGDVVALSGDLGAGKTCLVQGIARGLGVPEDVPVTSPTFTLVGEYPGRLVLRHADFYRVDGYERLHGAGFNDLLDARGVLVVEWAERLPDALPDERLEIMIEIVTGPGAERDVDPPRRITFAGRGLRARAIRQRVLESCR